MLKKLGWATAAIWGTYGMFVGTLYSVLPVPAPQFFSDYVKEHVAEVSERVSTAPMDDISREINKWGTWAEPFLDDLKWRYEEYTDDAGSYSLFSHRINMPVLSLKADDSWNSFWDDIGEEVCTSGFSSRKLDEEEIGLLKSGKTELIDLLDLGSLVKVLSYSNSYDQAFKECANDFTASVNHELSHALVDGAHGIMHSEGYAGPDFNDLSLFVQSLRERDDLVSHFPKLDKVYLKSKLEDVVEEYGSVDAFLSEDLFSNFFYETYVEHIRNPGVSGSVYFGTIDKDFSDYSTSIDNRHFKTVMREMHAHLKEFGVDAKQGVIVPLGNSGKAFYVIGTGGAYFEVEEGGYSIYASMEFNLAAKNTGEYSVSGYFDYVKKVSLYRSVVTESLARVIKSLMTVHLGAPEQNAWPLGKEELAFLETMTYEGEQIFGDAIEKYRLGMEMVEAGFSPEVVQSKLEYAESYVWKGRQYDWTFNDFSVAGRMKVASVLEESSDRIFESRKQ